MRLLDFCLLLFRLFLLFLLLLLGTIIVRGTLFVGGLLPWVPSMSAAGAFEKGCGAHRAFAMRTSFGLGADKEVANSASGGGSILAILSGFFHPSFLSCWLPDFIIGNYRWLFRMIESWSIEYHANNQFVVRVLYYATSMILLLDYTPHRMHDECKESSCESHKG